MSAPMRVKVFSGDNYIKVTNEINAFLDSKDMPITKAQINTCCYSGSIFITLLYEVHKKPEPLGVVASIAVGFFLIWIVLLILSKIFGLVFLAVFVLPAFLVSLVAGIVFLFIAALAYYVI